MKLTLKIWRQEGPKDKGRLVAYAMDDVAGTCRSWSCSTS